MPRCSELTKSLMIWSSATDGKLCGNSRVAGIGSNLWFKPKMLSWNTAKQRAVIVPEVLPITGPPLCRLSALEIKPMMLRSILNQATQSSHVVLHNVIIRFLQVSLLLCSFVFYCKQWHIHTIPWIPSSLNPWHCLLVSVKVDREMTERLGKKNRFMFLSIMERQHWI